MTSGDQDRRLGLDRVPSRGLPNDVPAGALQAIVEGLDLAGEMVQAPGRLRVIGNPVRLLACCLRSPDRRPPAAPPRRRGDRPGCDPLPPVPVSPSRAAPANRHALFALPSTQMAWPVGPSASRPVPAARSSRRRRMRARSFLKVRISAEGSGPRVVTGRHSDPA